MAVMPSSMVLRNRDQILVTANIMENWDLTPVFFLFFQVHADKIGSSSATIRIEANPWICMKDMFPSPCDCYQVSGLTF